MGVVVGAIAGSIASSAGAGALAAAGFTAFAAQALGALGGLIVSKVVTKALGGGSDDEASVAAGAAAGVTVNTASNVASIPVIYGYRKVGGARVFQHIDPAQNNYLYIMDAIGEGPVYQVANMYLDDVLSTDARWSGGFVTSSVRLGDVGQSADTLLASAVPTKITPNHRQDGTACASWRLILKEVSGAQIDPAPKFGGVPTRSYELYGRTVLDTRTSVTGYSSNPAMCLRDYLTNSRYGRGIPEASIDDTSFEDAADYCDELITVPDGAGGTTTQLRYSCDAVLDPDNGYIENLRILTSSCRGMLIYSGGLYRLKCDKEETPTAFGFTEDNIVGAWQISAANKRSRFNRVKARFINPARNWQPDFAVYDSPAYRAIDNGLLLEREIALDATTDYYRALRIAEEECRQSRFGITASFRATIAGMQCEVGDVVPITHSTPGWVAKPFRVLRIELLASDEVEVTVREYDDAVYDLDAPEEARTSPSTALPDPLFVSPPGALAVTESLYQTRVALGIKARATLTWLDAGNALIAGYETGYQLVGADTWTEGPRTSFGTVDIDDIPPGDYNFRVRGLNSLGIASVYTTTRAQMYGLSAAPAALTGLTIQTAGGLAILQWAQSTDVDVLIGGRIDIRHSNSESGGVLWSEATPIGKTQPGAATLAVLPLKSGTYFVRPYDSSGIAAPGATSISTGGATVLEFANIDTLTEDPTFSGTKTATVIDAGALKLDSVGDFDSQADVDAIENIDSVGGIVSEGSYGFATTMDLATVQRVRLTSRLEAAVISVIDEIDSRGGDIDDWPNFDGTDGDEAQAWVEWRSTPDDPAGTPTWSAWNTLDASEANARAFQFRAQLRSYDADYNIAVSALSVDADAIV